MKQTVLGSKEVNARQIVTLNEDFDFGESYKWINITQDLWAFDFKIQYNLNVPVWNIYFYSIVDLLTEFGGSFSTFTTIFVTVPIAIVVPYWFLGHIIDFIHRRKRKRAAKKAEAEGYGEVEEISEAQAEMEKMEIRKKYLNRVSQVGIYTLFDQVERNHEHFETRLEEQNEVIRKLKQELSEAKSGKRNT